MYEGQSQWQKRTFKPRFFRLLPVILTILCFFTGCVNYDIGINFQTQHHGTIVQQIELKQQLIDLSPEVARDWLTTIEMRAKELGGKTQIISPRVVAISIPFNNGADLVTKFNRFFNPNSQSISQLAAVTEPAIEQLYAEASIEQSNLLFLERNRLSLAIDLRAFNLISATDDRLALDPNNLVNLKFSLSAPWGTKNIGTNGIRSGNRLVWQLQPAQINRIEAVFWVPSILGIGTIAIVLLMLVGSAIATRVLPRFQAQS